MDDARELARAGCPEGTVAVADYQEKGPGEGPGRTWVSAPRESLLATLVLKIPGLGYDLEELPLRAGVAVALGIEDAAGIAVGIKWPNDVVAGAGARQRVESSPGLLCETHGDAALVGFGVNLLQTSFPGEIGRTACSLVQACGRILSRGHAAGRDSPPPALLGSGNGVAARAACAAASKGRGGSRGPDRFGADGAGYGAGHRPARKARPRAQRREPAGRRRRASSLTSP